MVSALMVTRNRLALARRSLASLAAQTWPAIELVVVDDGEEDYAPALQSLPDRIRARYVRLAHDPALRLGALRNIALENARGEYCAQWDDDEWFHPQRLALQLESLLRRGLEAVELRYYLVHLDDAAYRGHPFRSDSGDGAPGSIVHRRSDLRYPNLARSEDLAYERAFRRRGGLGLLGRECSHLMVRCYHGANTWQRQHFERHLRRGLLQRIEHFWARRVRADPLRQRAFALDAAEAETAACFLRQSREAGLLAAA
jgi:glycosyltransferase involved in cell wall biosynthesis